MVFSGPKRVFFVPKKGVFRGDFRLNIQGMYKSLKMLWRFFGELGHGADPRARKKLGRLLSGTVQRIEDEDGILNGALLLILVLALDHGRRTGPHCAPGCISECLYGPCSGAY